MTAVSRTIDAPLEDVWDALVDVRTYPSWLIGAQKIRAVDDDWPEPGSAFHHTVGIGGPLTLSDRTRCREIDPPHRLVLDIKARPLVHGTVTFNLSRSAAGTEVTLEEHPVGIHRIMAPVLVPLTQMRNRSSLENLERRVQERSSGSRSAD